MEDVAIEEQCATRMPLTPDQREELAKSCMPMCRALAREAARENPGADLQDLLSAAQWGLLKSLRAFDVSLGNQFSTLAYVAIGRAIDDELEKTARRRRFFSLDELRANAGLLAPPSTDDPADLAAEEEERYADDDSDLDLDSELGWVRLQVREAVETLPEALRVVADLAMQGLGVREIGERIGRDQRSVRGRLYLIGEALAAAGLGH